ncbi:hypothetical protein [Roseomonas populi]|uniref:Uncharacterized protein n=1 Tax=Roseomonas populi TaxID=3121582 RepID=A0ABT1XBW7_9PROT|nr:hypothetical protein [Roseomonas pecuniae]MCR0985424.1 hypothetical protein [Roseomonas pecuniae]
MTALLALPCSMVGTSAAKRLLETMTDLQIRRRANRLIAAIAGYYVVQGTVLHSLR